MILKSIEDTKKIAQSLANEIINKKVIFLYGKIGVGKTTFVRFLINYLQKKNHSKITQITSPTFNLVSYYQVKRKNIIHYDLYRIKDFKELRNIMYYKKYYRFDFSKFSHPEELFFEIAEFFSAIFEKNNKCFATLL